MCFFQVQCESSADLCWLQCQAVEETLEIIDESSTVLDWQFYSIASNKVRGILIRGWYRCVLFVNLVLMGLFDLVNDSIPSRWQWDPQWTVIEVLPVPAVTLPWTKKATLIPWRWGLDVLNHLRSVVHLTCVFMNNEGIYMSGELTCYQTSSPSMNWTWVHLVQWNQFIWDSTEFISSACT